MIDTLLKGGKFARLAVEFIYIYGIHIFVTMTAPTYKTIDI